MAVFGRKQPRDPAKLFDEALHAENVTDQVTGEVRLDMLNAWVDVNAECGVSARDFLRIVLRRPTKIDHSIVADAAARVAKRRGIQPPADKWAYDDIVAYHVAIMRAIASGTAGDEIETMMEAMPSYPTNTRTHIMLMLQDLGRVTANLGHLLGPDLAASDPMLGAARHIIDLASRNRWDEAGIVVAGLCDQDPDTPNKTGESGLAMQGILLGLLNREFNARL